MTKNTFKISTNTLLYILFRCAASHKTSICVEGLEWWMTDVSKGNFFRKYNRRAPTLWCTTMDTKCLFDQVTIPRELYTWITVQCQEQIRNKWCKAEIYSTHEKNATTSSTRQKLKSILLQIFMAFRFNGLHSNGLMFYSYKHNRPFVWGYKGCICHKQLNGTTSGSLLWGPHAELVPLKMTHFSPNGLLKDQGTQNGSHNFSNRSFNNRKAACACFAYWCHTNQYSRINLNIFIG